MYRNLEGFRIGLPDFENENRDIFCLEHKKFYGMLGTLKQSAVLKCKYKTISIIFSKLM